MILKGPADLLFANTARFNVQPAKRMMTHSTKTVNTAAEHRIGILVYDAKAGLLYKVLERMNDCQDRYAFYPVEAPLPTGLGRLGPELVERWEGAGKDMADGANVDLRFNVLVDDFDPHLEAIREEVVIDVILCMTSSMLAWTDGEGRLRHDSYAVHKDRHALISTHGLRWVAKKADRPFEAIAALLILEQTCESLFEPSPHPDAERSIGSLRDECMASDWIMRIPQGERPHVKECLESIGSYDR